VTPGVTCIWQVRGRSQVSFAAWVRMDLEYIARRSIWFDLQLLLETIPAVFFCRGM
jgi:lipopolysaccharide/colanic/teichoic acid biosynthesis glycosyltransferase